ncbi:MAG: hypothetical protein Q9174_002100, partial [Haloplaca sp. 1 TL-2023]
MSFSSCIASQIGFDLLKQGIKVRGTTRRKESANALLNGAYAPYQNLVEIVQVPDITLEGAFDEAVKGVPFTPTNLPHITRSDPNPFPSKPSRFPPIPIILRPEIVTTSIIHTASPLSYALTTHSTTVSIATSAALSILNSALHHAGPQLQSFVLTSSFAACNDPSTSLPKTFTEDDWNEWAEAKAGSKEFGEMDDLAKAKVLYPASKTAAERAVWKWSEEFS